MIRPNGAKVPRRKSALGHAVAGSLALGLCLACPSTDHEPPEDRETQETGSARIPSIAEHGRLALDASEIAELTQDGALVLDLLADADAFGEQPLAAVRIVSVDGRKFDLIGRRVEGKPARLRIEIERAGLHPGLYMIEFETAEPEALNLRRYVLQLIPAPRKP